ncbi:Rrf2 family transcriptional regulator [uncultured Deinococcus sp.]|uniref:Rrf2 family transcriptional regulator n=1 Tax=uncultured Deinococcus sp. TaxID=158789 RepID=UPI002590D43D|nr:Rrf2 family transcriptional regulator [uncultured Deinococcus sp.]
MNHQYAVAVHILSLLDHQPASSSEELAGSVGVHPVVIRTVTGLLRRAGLLETRRGVPGARLARPPREITLLDVYRAVNAPEQMLKHHPRPNVACPVGANIQAVLDATSRRAQDALEAELAAHSLGDVLGDLQTRIEQMSAPAAD